jgi:hypothetical protein
MVTPDTALGLLEVKRAMVVVVKGASTIGAHLAMDFSMPDGPLASHNGNFVLSWLQHTVEAHQLLLDNIVGFAMSYFGRAHSAFRLLITCAVRRYGLLLRTLLPNICRPYFANA